MFRSRNTAACCVQAAWRNALAKRETARLLACIQSVVRQAMAVRRIERSTVWWLARRQAAVRLRAQRAKRAGKAAAISAALQQWAVTRVQSMCRQWLARKRAADIRNAQANAVQRSVLQSWFGDAQLLTPSEAASSLAPSLQGIPRGVGWGAATSLSPRSFREGASVPRRGQLSGPGADLPVVSTAYVQGGGTELVHMHSNANNLSAAASAGVDPTMRGFVPLDAAGRPAVPNSARSHASATSRGFTPTSFYHSAM
jgi:hypothetical protein